ncbi:MAG: hypothetical protein ACXAD7_06050 [Candidatus Kariarchaeaceae archaeon]|jgi:hypothetical protein
MIYLDLNNLISVLADDDLDFNMYTLKPYEDGFEEYQSQIGVDIAKTYPWPHIDTVETLKSLYKRREFDPESSFSCFKNDKMVGFSTTLIFRATIGINIIEGMGAFIDYPQVEPGFEEVAELIISKSIEVLEAKKAKFIRMRVVDYQYNNIGLAEKFGFKPLSSYPPGFKLYYHYDLSKGKLDIPTDKVKLFDQKRDLEEVVPWVAKWFFMQEKDTRNWIREVDSQADTISHLVIREKDELVGYCFAYPNPIVKDIIATYYIEAKNEEYLQQLIVQTINNAVDKNYQLFLIDLVKDLLQYKELVESLGFERVATFGTYEKRYD